MAKDHTTIVDFVARGATADEWKLVLVEQGPWTNPFQAELMRVQDRLYGCVNAALDGQLAEKFPETKDKNIIIQLDCYNLPRADVFEFFAKFSNGVFRTPDYQQELAKQRFVKGISFDVTFDSIN